MSLLGFAVRYGGLRRLIKSNNQGLPLLLLRQSPTPFSTGAEPPQDPSSTDPSTADASPTDPSTADASPTEASPADPFLQALNTGLTYGRLYGTGVSKYTLKTDIVKLLEGCNLTPQDVKVEYNRSHAPVNVMVQFPSWSAYDSAFRIIKKVQLYRLDRADRSQWDSLKPYDGKFLLLEGIPRTAVQDDVERFLSSFEFDASSIQMFLRQAFPESIRIAVVRFSSQTQAMNAALLKNRQFLRNNQVSVRVLQ